MKLKNIAFLLTLSCLLFGFTNPTETGMYIDGLEEKADIKDDIIVHTVVKGETVYSIATAYNTTEQEIFRLNPKAEKGIKAGEKLYIAKPKFPSRYSDHLIEAKETLFSVAKMYKISVGDIKNANPGLDESTFRVGRNIKIPVFDGTSSSIDYTSSNNTSFSGSTNINTSYKVQKGETLYSISRTNGVTVESLLNANPAVKETGLKEGMYIIIPNPQQENRISYDPLPTNLPVVTEQPYAAKGELVRIGILLPFNDKKGSVTTDKLAEYYEGFLLAVKDLKAKGLNAEIYTFDIGEEKNTKKLESLLGTNEVNSLHLIIGGVSQQQIDILTKFSEKQGISYVIPFGSTKKIETTPTLFRMTSGHSSLYPEISEAFKQKFRDYNIIFVSEAASNNDKADFVSELKKELSNSAITFKTISGSSNLTSDIKNDLSTVKKNILIPTSSSEVTLRKVLTSISALPAETVTLFGYPEWQTYNQHASNLHKYDATIYSIFFLNENDSAVKDFMDEYKKWYNKKLINSYPKYGYLGYDTGLYFLTALNKYGSRFEENINGVNVRQLQSAISFKKENMQGGYINKGIYFIRYKTNSEIEKTDIANRW